jgi:hypothetical protein
MHPTASSDLSAHHSLFARPLSNPRANGRENWAPESIYVTTVVFILPALCVRRRWKTALGTFPFLYTFLLLVQVGLGEFKQ